MKQSKQQAGIGIAKGFGPHVSLCNWDSHHVSVVAYSSSYVVERGSVPYIVVGDLLF